jgi:hypothetical protein
VPIVLLGIIVVIVLLWSTGALSNRMNAGLKRAALVIGGILLLVLLVRAGRPGIAAVGAALAFLLRYLGPVLARLLEFLLVRRSNEAPKEPPAPAPTQMTPAEALEILGLGEGASIDEIRKAHAELIKKVHPDRGGTAYLAARVNLARDLLLSGK